jgi:hypothetical protein
MEDFLGEPMEGFPRHRLGFEASPRIDSHKKYWDGVSRMF